MAPYPSVNSVVTLCTRPTYLSRPIIIISSSIVVVVVVVVVNVIVIVIRLTCRPRCFVHPSVRPSVCLSHTFSLKRKD